MMYRPKVKGNIVLGTDYYYWCYTNNNAATQGRVCASPGPAQVTDARVALHGYVLMYLLLL